MFPDWSGTCSHASFKFTAFLVPSVEPVFVGIHDFLNPPPWIHMVDYRYVSPGVAKYL